MQRFEPSTNGMTPFGMPTEIFESGNFTEGTLRNDEVSRDAAPDPTATPSALAATGRNPTDITMPVLVRSEGSGGADGGEDDAVVAGAGSGSASRSSTPAEVAVEPYEAARLADALRKKLIGRGESFVFDTVFSDPVGGKVAFLEEAAGCGYVVVLCYIGLSGPDQSAERVAMRVSQGGHDVPDDKLQARFSRTLANLQAAIARLPHVLIYDNSDMNVPYRLVAVFDHGQTHHLQEPIPEWLRPVLT